jgi:hypothetical protein
VIESQTTIESILDVELMVRFNVTIESQPTQLVKIKVGVLVLVV